MKVNDLIKFLKAHPYISIRQLGISIGYSQGKYLIEVLNSNRETLPPAMCDKLKPVLTRLEADSKALFINELENNSKINTK